jgi:ribosomal protein S18 acetylase RimI-like enzyme
MTVTIRQAAAGELEELLPLLLLAEPSQRALEWSLEHLSDAVYRMEADGQLCGAATMRWEGEACELVELGIAPERQGQGLGRQLVAWLLDEARRRGRTDVIVGTSSTSAGNILFYQKCGFRVDSVRRDYFWYYDRRHYENGLPVRDMIVFRWSAEEPRVARRM